MFAVCVDFAVPKDRLAEFLPLMQAQARNSFEREEGCHHFDICVPDTGDGVFLYELYTDRAAFDAHLATPHFRDFDAKAVEIVTSKAVRTFTLQNG